MEILEMLAKQADELYPEDLDVIEAEIATSEYSEDYKRKCYEKLSEVKKWLESKDDSSENKQPDDPVHKKNGKGLFLDLADVIPASGDKKSAVTVEQTIVNDISRIRRLDSYKSEFKKYINKTKEIDSSFIETHISFFQPWEMGTILTEKQMGEAFLEKYFDALDHNKIARCQEFSESFFMKHFAKLDTKLVLEHGVNEWRKKDKRSKQLDVFLRLKGVKE